MARVRVGGLLAGTPPHLRIGGISASGVVAGGVGRLRLGEIRAAGVVQVVLNPMVDQTVEPLTSLTLTASQTGASPVPDTWTWRVVPGGLGSAVTLTGTGATRSFVTPTDPDLGGYVDIGVIGTYSGTPSVEEICRITVLPHLFYALTGGLVAMLPLQFL